MVFFRNRFKRIFRAKKQITSIHYKEVGKDIPELNLADVLMDILVLKLDI